MAVDIKNIPASLLQTTANPAATTLSSGNVVDIVLQDAATNTAPTIMKLEHGTSGTPVATASPTSSFGETVELFLDDTVNAKREAAKFMAWWRAVGAAPASNAGSFSIFAVSGGAYREVARFNDYAVILWGGSVANPGIGFLQDERMGFCLDGGNRVGIVHTQIEVCSFDTSGGVPRVGFGANVAAPAAAAAVGATLTNNVTAGGSANVIANYTDLVVYANDAAAIRNDIYQLSLKLAAMETGLKAQGWIKT